MQQLSALPFLRYRYLAAFFSVSLLLVSIISFFFKGFYYGVDFAGGTVIQIKFDKQIKISSLRQSLDKTSLQSADIIHFGEDGSNEFLITLSGDKKGASNPTKLTEELKKAIHTASSDQYSIRRVESVGPKVGKVLKEKAIYAALYALLGILVYVWFRFQFSFGIGAILALFHDVIICLGVLSLFSKEINLTTVASILTIVGYSLNDTIVIFDRIRESKQKQLFNNIKDTINYSITSNLRRTILTSLTTLFVVLSLYFLGGDLIKDFGFILTLGVIVGTYSSVFIASPVLLFFDKKRLK